MKSTIKDFLNIDAPKSKLHVKIYAGNVQFKNYCDEENEIKENCKGLSSTDNTNVEILVIIIFGSLTIITCLIYLIVIIRKL